MVGKYTKNQIEIHERALKVRSMRIAGLTYQQIASKLKISIDTVRADLKRIKVEFPEQTAKELTADQNAKIELMLTPMVLKGAAGDTKAVQAAIRLMDHQAKLFGVYDVKPDSGQGAAMELLGSFMEATIEAVQEAAKK